MLNASPHYDRDSLLAEPATSRAALFEVTSHGDVAHQQAEAAAVRDLGVPWPRLPNEGPRVPRRAQIWRREVINAWRFGVVCGVLPGMGLGAVLAIGGVKFALWLVG